MTDSVLVTSSKGGMVPGVPRLWLFIVLALRRVALIASTGTAATVAQEEDAPLINKNVFLWNRIVFLATEKICS